MLTGTDESISLEEWNVDTIAHLEAEKASGSSVLWDKKASEQHFFLITFFVLIYSKKTKTTAPK